MCGRITVQFSVLAMREQHAYLRCSLLIEDLLQLISPQLVWLFSLLYLFFWLNGTPLWAIFKKPAHSFANSLESPVAHRSALLIIEHQSYYCAPVTIFLLHFLCFLFGRDILFATKRTPRAPKTSSASSKLTLWTEELNCTFVGPSVVSSNWQLDWTGWTAQF